MKKILAIALVLFTLMLCGCGASQEAIDEAYERGVEAGQTIIDSELDDVMEELVYAYRCISSAKTYFREGEFEYERGKLITDYMDDCLGDAMRSIEDAEELLYDLGG